MKTMVGTVSKERMTRWAKTYGFQVVKDNPQQYQLKLTMKDEKDDQDKNVSPSLRLQYRGGENKL